MCQAAVPCRWKACMNVAVGSDWDVRIFGRYEALVFGNQTFSNVTLRECASRLAGAFLEHDIRPGSTIVTQLDSCPEFVIAFEAVLRAGCVFVPLSAKTPPALRERIVDQCGAVALIVSSRTVGRGNSHGVKKRFCIEVDRDPLVGARGWEFWNVIARHSP